MVARTPRARPLLRCSGTLHVVDGRSRRRPLHRGAGIERRDLVPHRLSDTDPRTATTACIRSPAHVPCTGDADCRTRTAVDPNAFFLHDLGVVTLDVLGDRPSRVEVYGALPEAGALDCLKSQKQGVLSTSVGYGAPGEPSRSRGIQTRRCASRMSSRLRGSCGIDDSYVGDFAMTPVPRHQSGGTCFGDSGGPNFHRRLERCRRSHVVRHRARATDTTARTASTNRTISSGSRTSSASRS